MAARFAGLPNAYFAFFSFPPQVAQEFECLFPNGERIAATRRFRDAAWLGLKASHYAIEYRRAAIAVKPFRRLDLSREASASSNRRCCKPRLHYGPASD